MPWIRPGLLPIIRMIAAALALGATAAALIVVDLSTRPPVLRASTRRGAPAVQANSYCAAMQGPGFDGRGAIAHTGRYVNATYGYAVTIPPGLTGYTAAAAAPRGFGIILSEQPSAFLRVDAGYDALYDITATGVHLRDTATARLFDKLLQDRSESYSLAGVQGGRYHMTVRCAGSGRIYVYDEVIVVRDREIYRLDLQSVPARLAADDRVLEAMLRSFSWVPLRP